MDNKGVYIGGLMSWDEKGKWVRVGKVRLSKTQRNEELCLANS
jgi:hypothetical protein